RVCAPSGAATRRTSWHGSTTPSPRRRPFPGSSTTTGSAGTSTRPTTNPPSPSACSSKPPWPSSTSCAPDASTACATAKPTTARASSSTSRRTARSASARPAAATAWPCAPTAPAPSPTDPGGHVGGLLGGADVLLQPAQRVAEGALGVEARGARRDDRGEQLIPQRGLPGGDRIRRPQLEPHPLGAPHELRGERERRHRLRDAVEHALPPRLLDLLQLVPAGGHRLGGVGDRITEDVRVPAHHLRRHVGSDI